VGHSRNWRSRSRRVSACFRRNSGAATVNVSTTPAASRRTDASPLPIASISRRRRCPAASAWRSCACLTRQSCMRRLIVRSERTTPHCTRRSRACRALKPSAQQFPSSRSARVETGIRRWGIRKSPCLNKPCSRILPARALGGEFDPWGVPDFLQGSECRSL